MPGERNVTSLNTMTTGEAEVREAAPPPTAPIRERESIPALVREAVDGLIELVGAHIKLTNLELIADLQTKAPVRCAAPRNEAAQAV